MFEPSSLNTLQANGIAVILAFWTRLPIETYPGIRRSSVILPAALTGHGVAVVWFLLTRFSYDRSGLAAGFIFHVAWLSLLYIRAEGAPPHRRRAVRSDQQAGPDRERRLART